MGKCRYMLTEHTKHSKRSQDITTSDDLQTLIDTADYMKHRLYKDQAITIVDTQTGELMHIVERW